jgi:D-alanyl-lipoteichoic acid acyltransferase DltB (MBOAT superfamily)
MSNFKFPYFSRNIGEFWRRWHISLSTWFRDYLYIPLGGSQEGKWKSIRNVFIIFLVSGFWHGANWTFIFWGGFHSILFLPSFIFKTNRKYTSSIIAENTFLPSLKEFLQVGTTFILVTVGWVFFRSNGLIDSIQYLLKMFSDFQIPSYYRSGLMYVVCIFILDYLVRGNERLTIKYFKFDWVIFSILILLILEKFGSYNEFIYFQF